MTLVQQSDEYRECRSIQRATQLLRDHGSRIGTIEGRLLVVEALGEDWKEACRTTENLRVSTERLDGKINTMEATIREPIAELKTMVRITWFFLSGMILSLIGVAFAVFRSGVV